MSPTRKRSSPAADAAAGTTAGITTVNPAGDTPPAPALPNGRPGKRLQMGLVTGLALPIGLRLWSRRQREVRAWERTVSKPAPRECRPPRSEADTSVK